MHIEQSLLYAINGMVHRWNGLDFFGQFSAVFLLPVMIVLVLFVGFTVKRFKEEHWYEFPLKAMLVGGAAFVASAILKVLIARPRPFMVLQDVQLLVAPEHDYSFPSGHASVAFALGFFIYRHDKDWGIAFLLLAIVVSLARIFVGIHYPLDVLGGAVVGWLSAWAMYAFEHRHWVKHNRTLGAR